MKGFSNFNFPLSGFKTFTSAVTYLTMKNLSASDFLVPGLNLHW